jgi:hypothetical protein
MGQSQTTLNPDRPALTKTQILFGSLSRTLPPLSLQDYNSIFATLAETDGTTKFWKEDTLARFLEVPAKIGSLLFKSASYLAALPSFENVPVPLDREGLGIAVMVLTQRIPQEILTKQELTRLLFNSFAEVVSQPPSSSKEQDAENGGKQSNVTYGPQISVVTMSELILFLLSVTTPNSLSSAESTIATTTSNNRHAAATITKSMITAMRAYAKSPSDVIHYDAFRAFCERDAPFFFDPFVPLFQHFLFDTKKWGDQAMSRDGWIGALQSEKESELLTLATLAQISMFLPKERRLGKLVGLYAGSRDGFSMGMFESKVLKYPGTDILE